MKSRHWFDTVPLTLTAFVIVNFTIVIVFSRGRLVALLSLLVVSLVCSHRLTATLLLAVQIQLNGPPSLP